MVKINIPIYIENCIKKLSTLGYEAYIVGGCVRDSIIERKPNDWDICTSALPEEIKKVFKEFKTIDIGIQHGTVAVIIDENVVEITTFRIDGEYRDNRRPSSVEFTSLVKEDLKRRDFTINAMAYNEDKGIFDFFNGGEDLKNKIIRCVGNPLIRFNEDALRIMRGIRFASQLNYSIDYETWKAMVTCKKLLNKVSSERIREELNKILLSDYPQIGIDLLLNCGFIYDIIPMIKDIKNEDKTWMKSLTYCPKKLELRLAIFLNYILHMGNEKVQLATYKKTTGEEIMRFLKYDNVTIKNVSTILNYYNVEIEVDKFYIKKFLSKMERSTLLNIIEIRSMYNDKNATKALEILKDIDKNNEPYKINQLNINGNDLIVVGIPKGKTIGKILGKLLELVMEDPKLNEKDKLLSKALSIYIN